MNFCDQCGEKLKSNASFCTNCGKKIFKTLDNEGIGKTECLNDNGNKSEQRIEMDDTLHVSEYENNAEILDMDKDTMLNDDNNEVEMVEMKNDEEINWVSKIKNIGNKVLGLKSSSIIRKIMLGFLVVVIIGGIGTIAYSQITRPERLKKQISLGNKYLSQNKYAEAIIEFLKAIKIDPKNIELRIGLANAYMHLDKFEEVEEVLLQALKIDKMNKEVILMFIDLWKDSKPKELYKILEEYIKNAGASADERIKRFYESMKKAPVLPTVSLPSGRYTAKNEVKITIGNQEGSSIFYYTLDGTQPNEKDGKIYKKPIQINEGHTIIKVVAVNALNVSSGVVTFEYFVDERYKDRLIELVKQAQSEYDNAKEGKEVGKYQEGSKEVLLQVIQSAQEVINRKTSTQLDIDAKHSELNTQLHEFRKKKIPQSNKSDLSATVNKAKQRVNLNSEDTSDKQITLSMEIIKAETVLNSNLATQKDVDTASMNLKNAMAKFEEDSFELGDDLFMERESRRNFKGTFKVIKTGEILLANASGFGEPTKKIYVGETGSMILLLRSESYLSKDNKVMVNYSLEFDKNKSVLNGSGIWKSKCSYLNKKFIMSSSGGKEGFEGTYNDGVMKGEIYMEEIGSCIEFTVEFTQQDVY